ncbi:Gfo/Idh/MocA family protein [Listeria costaricensis]|uniref:Gfo/Idh/MocA family protein n=1 Tax=Listeria costaricensis TaxID=2026604 RepID=UPI000C087A5C|nr:Gfo/Idh/MocA family oxidoreductase [Listeria costaricensis]
MKVGIIGLGNIAQKAYLPVFAGLRDVELHLCTRNKEKLNLLSEKYRFQHVHEHVEELIASGIDCAFVHSATSSHYEIVKQLLERRIPVYVDKPITDRIEETEELTTLAEQQEVLLMTGFNRRFAPRYQALKEVADVNMIVMQKNRSGQPGEARTFVYDDFIHVLDTVRFLLDAKVENMQVHPVWKGELLAALTVQFEAAGKTATAIMNRDSGVNEEVVAVYAPDGKRVVEQVTEWTHYSGTDKTACRFSDWDTTLYKRGFEPIIQAFLAAVRDGEKEPIDLWDAFETHRLAEEILLKLMD